MSRHVIVFALTNLVLAIAVVYSTLQLQMLRMDLDAANVAIDQQGEEKKEISDAYTNLLFEDHLRYITYSSVAASRSVIEKEYETFKLEAEGARLEKIESVFALYQETVDALDANATRGADTAGIENELSEWGELFLGQEFDPLQEKMQTAKSILEANYTEYLASLPTPTIIPTQRPAVATTANGYSFESVQTDRGIFSAYIIKLPLSSYTVKTVAANESDCIDNCPAKSLAEYVSENGGYAGIHGSYFCPPDYAHCVGKVNSYDFAVYDSNTRSWRNEHTLQWYKNSFAGFSGASILFYEDIQQFAFSGSSVTAGISNFPALVDGGSFSFSEGELDSYQLTVKGTRGAIGVDATNIYLVVATGATVPDMAHVMKSLGATDALNLDGGGSSALYVGGSYKVGPGRALPNAIVLVAK